MSTNGHAQVLVVEDDQDVRDTILDLLSDEGVPAAGMADGASALRFLKSAPVKPNLILLDLMMPGVNGAEFRRLQMQDPSLAHIPVVLLSADVTTESASVEMRADGYLKKPVKLTKLLEVVQRYGDPAA